MEERTRERRNKETRLHMIIINDEIDFHHKFKIFGGRPPDPPHSPLRPTLEESRSGYVSGAASGYKDGTFTESAGSNYSNGILDVRFTSKWPKMVS